MKKRIYFLLVSTIMSSPLHAGTAGSVPQYDALDEKDFETSGLVYVPKGSLLKLQEENERLKIKIKRLEDGTGEALSTSSSASVSFENQERNIEEKEKKGKEPEEDTPAPPSPDLSFEKQGSEISMDREEELRLAIDLSLSLKKEKEKKGEGLEEDTPASPSTALSFKEKSNQPWLYSKLAGLSSSFTSTLDLWIPDLPFRQKISVAGFNPKLIDLYKEFSPTFERHARIRSNELIQFKSLISKELFLALLKNMEKDNPSLLEESARLGEVSGYIYQKCKTVDPHMYLADWLTSGIGGFKKNEKQAFEVMHTYGLAGHEGVRAIHLWKLFSKGRCSNSPEIIKCFRETLQEYVDQKSEIAIKIADLFLGAKKHPMQLTVDELLRVNMDQFNRYVSNLPPTKLSADKQKQIAHIESLFKGGNGYKQDRQEAYRLSVEYGIFLVPSNEICYK